MVVRKSTDSDLLKSTLCVPSSAEKMEYDTGKMRTQKVFLFCLT